MASRAQREWSRRARQDDAVARRDLALRGLRRATAVLATTAVIAVGAVSALAAATRPGHASSPTRSTAPPAAPDRSAGALQPPSARPTESGDDRAPATAPDAGATYHHHHQQQQQQPAPPPPPPVTSGGS
jgi:hypothetical protein